MDSRANDFFETEEEFLDTIDQADALARGEREMEFLEGLRYKLDLYGLDSFLSQKQVDWLRAIAER